MLSPVLRMIVINVSIIINTTAFPLILFINIDNPWRAPGSAPVVDPCGQAGGKYKETPVGGDSVFATVSHDGKVYQMGDLGSKVLPPTLPRDVANWTVGSTPRVAWGMRFNHGGGYQYRLCPLEKMPCSEEDFQQMPLDFVRNEQAIVRQTNQNLGYII